VVAVVVALATLAVVVVVVLVDSAQTFLDNPLAEEPLLKLP
jgi:hypothetical protein